MDQTTNETTRNYGKDTCSDLSVEAYQAEKTESKQHAHSWLQYTNQWIITAVSDYLQVTLATILIAQIWHWWHLQPFLNNMFDISNS